VDDDRSTARRIIGWFGWLALAIALLFLAWFFWFFFVRTPS
jgi:hypothetical protein